MFEKNTQTGSATRKLPAPFFEVLDQEQSALRGTAKNVFSYDFEVSHLKDAKGLLEIITPLFSVAEQANIPTACAPTELVRWLNQLLHTEACLYHNAYFPKPSLCRETIAMTTLALDMTELKRLSTGIVILEYVPAN